MANELQSPPVQNCHELDEYHEQQTQREAVIDQLRATVDQLLNRLEAQTKREGEAYLKCAEAEAIGRKNAEQIVLLEEALEIEKATTTELKKQTAHQKSIVDRATASEKKLKDERLRESARLHLHISQVEASRDKIKNSISWRCTAPFRSIVRFLRRPFKGS